MINLFDSLRQPQITPKTTYGGGDARPPYLQTRMPIMQGLQQTTKPVVTPKSMIAPGEAGGGITSYPGGTPGFYNNQPGSGGVGKPAIGKPAIGPTVPQPTKPPQAGGSQLGDLYNFFKSDLEAQRNKAISKTRADAAERGVFYGTPLTGSEADIETQYLRGLGQFSSGLFQSQQEDELRRLGLASDVIGPGYMPQAPEPLDLSGVGSMFAQQPANPLIQGPAITPKTGSAEGGKAENEGPPFNPALPYTPEQQAPPPKLPAIAPQITPKQPPTVPTKYQSRGGPAITPNVQELY